MPQSLEEKKKTLIKYAKMVRNAVLKSHDVRGDDDSGYHLYTRKGKPLGQLKVPTSVSTRIVPGKFSVYIIAAKYIVNRDRVPDEAVYTDVLKKFYAFYQEYIAQEIQEAAEALATSIQTELTGTRILNLGYSTEDNYTKIRLIIGPQRFDINCARDLPSASNEYLTYQFLMGELAHRMVEHPNDLQLQQIIAALPGLKNVLNQYGKSSEIFIDVGPVQYSAGQISRMKKVVEMTA